MINPCPVIAVVLAEIALALAIFGTSGDNQITGMQRGMSGHASLAASHFAGLSGSHVPGLVALALSGVAFAVSWNRRSYLVAGLLFATGILYTIHLAPFLGDHSIIAFSGPVVGLFIGHVILALGLAKGIGSARARIVQSPN
jgi:Na+-transporting NADH:ubiquinone oxidoreductase subunit NqrA